MRSDFKKFVASLTEEELREELSVLYQRFPQLREYYAVELSDDPRRVLENYKGKLHKTFFPKRGRGKRGRSESRKVIRAFRAVSDRTTDLAELLFYRAELMADYAAAARADSDQYNKSVHTAFEEACRYVQGELLLDVYREGARALAEKYNGNRRARGVRLLGIYREYFE